MKKIIVLVMTVAKLNTFFGYYLVENEKTLANCLFTRVYKIVCSP